MHNRRPAVQKLLRDSEVAALNEVIAGAAEAVKEGNRSCLMVLWRLSRTMDPVGLLVEKQQVELLTKYHLASRLDHNLYVVEQIALEWVRFFYDGMSYQADMKFPNPKPDRFQSLRMYMRSALMSDPLYVRDLEILARQGTPQYGLNPEVLIEEDMVVKRGDVWMVKEDLRHFYSYCFPHLPRKVQFYFR